MKMRTAFYLIIFGVYVTLLGVIRFQAYPGNAFATLIFDVGCGALSILWGVLGAKGSRWSRWAALLTAALLGLACVWRASYGLLAVVDGAADRILPSLVITLMLAVSGVMFWLLLKDGEAALKRNQRSRPNEAQRAHLQPLSAHGTQDSSKATLEINGDESVLRSQQRREGHRGHTKSLRQLL